MNRTFALLHIKSFEPTGRSFSGIATTPREDRVGDIIEPVGASFRNPLPLHLFHHGDEPVGHAVFGRPTADGIPFEASIPQVNEPGEVKKLTDKAAHLIQYGLIRAVSIGFRPVDQAIERLKSGGLRFLKTEILELSLVSIPANSDAVVSYVRSLSANPPAVSGTGATAGRLPPVVSGFATGHRPMNISEQLTARKAELKTKSARLEELLTKDETTQEENDERQQLGGEVGKIAETVAQLKSLESSQAALATPIYAPTSQQHVGAVVTQAPPRVEVKALPPGIEYARMVMCKIESFRGAQTGAFFKSSYEVARQYFPDNPRIHSILKAAVDPGLAAPGASPENWASPLVYADTLGSEFIEYLKPMTIVGRIPNLRRIPFNVRILGRTSGAMGYWVGEAQPKPLTKVDFAPTTLPWAKLANIAVLSEESTRFSNPGSEGLIRDALAEGIIAKMDQDFIDPGKAEDPGVSPASITNTATGIPSSGGDADAIRADINALVQPFITANLGVRGLVILMSEGNAYAAGMLVNGLGQPEFPNLTADGGTLPGGIQVITSQFLAAVGSPGNNIVVALNAREIFLSDDGVVSVDVSREASVEMSDTPSGSVGSPTGSQLVSFWQNNLIGLRAERFVNWAKRRESAVQYLSDVAWGTGSPL